MPKTVRHVELKSFFGSDDHLEVSQNRSFTRMIYETLTEKIPTPSELKLFELILNISIDHGPNAPSAVKTIEAAKEGKSISEGVAQGLMQINANHGGAIEPCMENYYKIQKGELDIKQFVKQSLEEGKRLAGYGHRIYKEEDPRTKLIFELMKKEGMSGEFIEIAQNLESELASQKGTKLPINIDGSIAVLLCTLGWEPKLSNAVFIIARVPGLCAQFLNNINS